MSVSAPISLEQYFAIDTKPYFEYVNGELVQKAMPTNLHSELQFWLGYLLLLALGPERNRIKTEQNCQLSESVIRLPDICILQQNTPRGEFAVKLPPLLCVEILSPSDRLSDTVKKCQDYLRWGVPSCWILKPESEEAWNVTLIGIDPIPADGVLQAGSISIPLKDVFQPNV